MLLQFTEKVSRCLEIDPVETLRQSIQHRGERLSRGYGPALLVVKTGQAGGGAQFPGQRQLLAGTFDGA